MIGVVLSLVLLFLYGYFLVGPANRGYSPRGWFFIATFLPFMYLFLILISLILGGAIEGRPVAPLASELAAIAYAVGVATATGAGAYLQQRRHAKAPVSDNRVDE